MNQHLFDEICSLYGLGQSVARPRSVEGGLLHRMWFLHTSLGKYAVKELNPEIMTRPSIKEHFELAEQAASQFADAGVPAIAALKAENQFVQPIDKHFIIVYPWIDGRVLDTRAVEKDQGFLIGKIIAQIHQIDLQIPGLGGDFLKTFSNQHWMSLFEDLKKKGLQDSQMESTFEMFLEWNEKAQQVLQRLQKNLVLSHGDIDQKNVIWTDEQHPFIVDWEGVGMVNPSVEIMDGALNWGGLVSGKLNFEVMKAVIQGYRSIHTSFKDSGEDALMGCVFKWGAWLERNMNQCVSSPEGSVELQHSLGQIRGTLKNLELIISSFEQWKDLLDDNSEAI